MAGHQNLSKQPNRSFVLCEVLRRARFDKKLTLAKVEKMTGISHGAINKIENNQTRNPSFSSVALLAKAYDISLEELAEKVIGIKDVKA